MYPWLMICLNVEDKSWDLAVSNFEMTPCRPELWWLWWFLSFVCWELRAYGVVGLKQAGPWLCPECGIAIDQSQGNWKEINYGCTPIFIRIYTHSNSTVIVLLWFLLQGSRLKGLKYQGYTGYRGLTCFKRIEVIGIDHLAVLLSNLIRPKAGYTSGNQTWRWNDVLTESIHVFRDFHGFPIAIPLSTGW